jgi:hypothetical protein
VTAKPPSYKHFKALRNCSSDRRYSNLSINGYSLTEGDTNFLRTFKFHNENDTLRTHRLVQIYAFDELKDRMYINWFEKFDGPVLTILSAKYHRIIGYAF